MEWPAREVSGGALSYPFLGCAASIRVGVPVKEIGGAQMIALPQNTHRFGETTLVGPRGVWSLPSVAPIGGSDE